MRSNKMNPPEWQATSGFFALNRGFPSHSIFLSSVCRLRRNRENKEPEAVLALGFFVLYLHGASRMLAAVRQILF